MGLELPGGDAVWGEFEALVLEHQQSRTFNRFERRFREFVLAHGWDAYFPPCEKGKFWEIALCIYGTQIAIDYAAMDIGQLRELHYRYWIYKCRDTLGKCSERHHDLDGVALAPSHPFWDMFLPPNGWGCSCCIRGADTDAGILRAKGDPNKELPDWWKTIDAVTGLPPGIDRGFLGLERPSLRDTVAALVSGAAP